MIVVEKPVTLEDMAVSFSKPENRERTSARLRRSFLPLILLLQACLTWRLSDIAFDDEALYINVGHDVINHYLHGLNIVSKGYGTYLSGAPNVYPPVAAVLDSAGGLELVRLFSLVLMLGTSLCLYGIMRHLASYRAALLSVLLFALTGTVQEIGKFATYDAPCLFLLALATYLAVTRISLWTGPIIGIILPVAVADKYVALIFVPLVLILTAVSWGITSGREALHFSARFLFAAGFVVELLYLGDHYWGSGIQGGLGFTTTGRKALDYQPYGVLISHLLHDVGIIMVLATIGLIMILRTRDWTRTVIFAIFGAAGCALPLAQLHIHEFTSFDKHTSYAAFFLAVPAGFALDRLFNKRLSRKIVSCLGVWILFIMSLYVSHLVYSWPSSIIKPIDYIKAHPKPGQYFSFMVNTERYYTGRSTVFNWDDAYVLFGEGQTKVIAAIKAGDFQGIIYDTGGLEPGQERIQNAMQKYLYHDPQYRLAATYRATPYNTDRWYVWIKKG